MNSDSSIVFEVLGEPQPQGSAKARNVPGKSYPIVFTDNPKLKAWRREIAKAARVVYRGAPLLGPVRVVAVFHVQRGKTVKRGSPTVPPDVDKCARGLADGMTGILYHDDAQITQFKVTKQYAAAGESPRSVIAVTPLTEEGRLL